MEIGMTNFDKMFQQIIPFLDGWSDEQEIPPEDIARFLIWVASPYVKHEDWPSSAIENLLPQCKSDIHNTFSMLMSSIALFYLPSLI